MFVWSGVTLAMGYATTFNQLYVLRAMMGVSEALYIPAGLALIVDYHRGSTRSLAVGIHMTGLYVGQALGGFGATVAYNWSWQITFQSFGLIGVIYSVVLILFLYEKREIQVPVAEFRRSGNLGHDMALLAIPVTVAVVLLLITLKPGVADKVED